MSKSSLSMLAALIVICAFALSPAVMCAAPPFLWEADTTFGGIADKAQVNQYLDNLKAHSINGIWIQVEFYGDGAVNYKKTTLSGLPTLEKFKTGQWADDDFLSYAISQARSRGMKVMIKFHGSNYPAWDKNPDWRKRNSKGEEVLWSGRLKNFCVNSPYWDKVFFPMLKEIAANYDVDGFYLDTCQVAYETDDCCFCPSCKARFEKETGKKLPLKPVDRKNWSDPLVKLHAIKRVEWMNQFYEQYGQTIEQAKPGAIALLNVSGSYNSYKDTLYTRHAGKWVTHMTPEPVNTPRMYAVVRNRELKKAGKQPVDERELAKEEIVPAMTRYGYHEFMVKTMLGDGGGKPVIPISRFWFTDGETMGPLELETAQIESAIGAGAKGYCFFGYLGSALAKNQAAGTTWADERYIEYLKDLTSGERAKWIADMQPDARVAILYDRDADFWTGDYWKRLKSVGGVFAALQFWRKMPVSLIAASEPDEAGFGKSGYKLDPSILSKYDIVIAPGLDYVSRSDLEALRDYTNNGGRLLIMGPIGHHGKFLDGSLTDDAYQILGITTVGEPEPSGFVVPVESHPVFTIPGGPTGPFGSFRISRNKYDALSYEPKFGDDWQVLAYEVNDNGKRPAIIIKETPKTSIGYLNSDMAAAFTGDMFRVLDNMVVVTTTHSRSIVPVNFSPTSSVNVFKSADGMTRYIHVFTLDGESDASLRIPANPGTYPVSAEVISGGGEPKPVSIAQVNRDPQPYEMVTAASGNGILKLPDIKPGFAMIKIRYEKKEQQ